MPAIGAIEIFVFRQGQFVGSRMFSPDRVVSIGRALDQGLRLDDDEVSSRHATLRVADGRLVIADAGSRNGVYVNGRKVQSAKVTSFDEILVGGCRLKIDVVGGMGHEEDSTGGASLEKTRVGPSPDAPVTQPPRGASTSLFVPRFAEGVPEPSSPATSPFLRPVPAPVPDASAPPVVVVAPPREPTPAAPPAAARAAAAPAAARASHRPEAAPPSFVDEDARTASIEFNAPAGDQAPVPGGSYWDFDEESATQPGRAGQDGTVRDDSQVSPGTRPPPGVDSAAVQSELVIVDPAAATAPAEAQPMAPTARAREQAAPHGARPGQPFPQASAPLVAPVAEEPPAPARGRSQGPRGEAATVKSPPPAAPPEPERIPAHPSSGISGAPVKESISGYSATPRVDADAVLAAETPADGIAGTVDTLETAPAMMAPPRTFLEDDEELEEDEVEERDWVEPFSLLENILRDHPKDAPSTSNQPAILEMIRYRERRIIDLVRLHRGDEFISFGGSGEEATGRFRLVRLHRDGRAQLFYTDATQGSVVLGGVTTPLRDLCVDDRLHDKRRQIYTVMLCEGDYAQILLETGGGFLMRFVQPPAAPPHTFGTELSAQDAIFLGCGVGAILLILAGIWGVQALAGPAEIKLQEEELTFAQVSLKDAQLQKPEEAKKVEVPEIAGAEMPVLEKIKVVARDAPRRTKVAAAGGPGPPGPPNPKPAGVLSALNDLRPAADSGDNALRAAVSNINAVRVPSGTSSAFQVSGTFSKLPGGEVRLATGGGGGGGKGRETRVGAELFRGEKGAKLGGLTGPAGGGGKVRGAVKSAGAPVTRGGILDAAAVQRVVSQHLGAVQACYERQLMKDPGLQGKITFDWDVVPSGSVGSARMVSSTMGTGGSSVAACIVAEIRRWKFPQPVGGTASVRYPFIFRMSGF